MVNAEATSGPIGSFHSAHCPARKRNTEKPEQIEQTTQQTTQKPTGEYVPHDDTQRDDLASIIAQAVAALLPKTEAKLDEDRVRALIAENGGASRNIVVTVRDSGKPAVDVGRQHARFPLLLAFIARRKNVYMVGPAGSGKTSAAHKASDALSLVFGSMSVGPQTTQSGIFGYMDAHGNYVATEFRRRYEHGGVFLFDEIDRGNPGVLTALNQAIENGSCSFPDKPIQKHADFVAIAAANTYGTGASREYVGALQLDASTLDRFATIAWGYDEQLETDLATATYAATGGTDTAVLTAWIGKVRKARKRAAELKIRHIVSPRASIVGAEMLATGMDEATVAECVLWKGLDSDSIERLS